VAGEEYGKNFGEMLVAKCSFGGEENIKLDVSEIVRGGEMGRSTMSGQAPRNSLVLNIHETLV
jgi:hypothetical protein